MGTRSLIGSVRLGGRVDYVYCFLDGFPAWNGTILHASTDPEGMLIRLFEVGMVSHITEEGIPVLAKGGEGESPRVSSNIEDFLGTACSKTDAEWVYLLDLDGEWLCAKTRCINKCTALKPLSQVLANLANEGTEAF